MKAYLSDFCSIRPPYETDQEIGFGWLSEAHYQSEQVSRSCVNKDQFIETISRVIAKVCCKKEKIAKRGHVLDDFLHRRWDEMQIYRLGSSPHGVGLGERSRFFAQYAETVFNRFYESEQAPDDLIHVTCTGYASSSAAQRLVTRKGWEKSTTVTHAYHMGCMGAMPAIRMGAGFCMLGKRRVDIVHTEICSLHLNLASHAPEQLVGQSLFADGFIKYKVTAEKPLQPSLQVLAFYEEIIPKSEELMRWECEEWGFLFTLSKQIPALIAGSIYDFVHTLIKKSGLTPEDILKNGLFAIHPGGPKIIDQICECLHLCHKQVVWSEKILYEYGNMSSATLPHIWERMLKEDLDTAHAYVIGLAFGPGLCMSGIVLKR